MSRKLKTTLAALGVGLLALLGLAGSGLVSPAGAVGAPLAASSPVLSTTERGLCIKQGTGEPRSLWLVAATGLCPAPYWGPASLEDAFGITLPAAAPVKAPAVVVEDIAKAPVLSPNATPSTTGIPVKWTPAAAPGDDTVVGYQARFRKTTVTTWTTVAPDLGNVLTTTVSKLDSGTRYEVQVRAKYGTSAAGAYGPWSNSVSSTTDDV